MEKGTDSSRSLSLFPFTNSMYSYKKFTNNNSMRSLKKTKYQLLIKKYAFEIGLIILGTMIMAIATSLFLLPNHLSSGGFSGIATITYYLFHWKMGTVILLLNIPLFILSFIRIGKKFVVKSILGTIFLSSFINLFEQYSPLTNDKILASIYGGILIGIGTSFILRAAASTGGSDLVSYILRSFKPQMATGTIIVIFDAIVIFLNVICFRQLEVGLYSAISIYLMGKVIDIVFEGIGFSKMVLIVSKKHEQIARKIGEEVLRGTTGFLSKGMYKGENKVTLMCVAGRREVIEIRKIASTIDPMSFIMITNVREVYGKGFKKNNV